jgi:hypothetical protein
VDEAGKKRRIGSTSGATAESERRRIGTVVHDDRGNASVNWHDAPADYERPVLEILGEHKLSIQNEESYDPYAQRSARGSASGSASGNTTRTDLRKLSEWIKMMRELEERKRRGGGDGGDES